MFINSANGSSLRCSLGKLGVSGREVCPEGIFVGADGDVSGSPGAACSVVVRKDAGNTERQRRGPWMIDEMTADMSLL